MGWLITRQRIREFPNIRGAFLIVSVLAFAVTELGRHLVRPYVRSSGFDDFGLTESNGNLGGIIVQIFFSFAIINPSKRQSYRLAAFFSIGYIVYEFAQPFLPKGTFDWNDVWGTVLGYCVAMPVLWLLWRIFPSPSGDQKADIEQKATGP
jgi:hypothetical protein